MSAFRRICWLLTALTIGLLPCIGFSLTPDASSTKLPTLRLALLKFGTANWEADVIKHHRLDHKHGFNLDVIPLASKQAGVIALQGQAADMILGDWVWVSRQRNAGHKLAFIPFSRCTGGLVVTPNSGIQSLADLAGRRLGIAGGPVDRNWLMIQALAQKQYDLRLDQSVDKVFGAPPLLYKKMLDGELDAVINYWHYLAKLEARGMHQLISMSDVVTQLGLEDDTPMLGYIFREAWAEKHLQQVAAMITASREAKQHLKSSDQEWQRLQPLLKARNQTEFKYLVEGFRAGIPEELLIDNTQSAENLYKILSEFSRQSPNRARGQRLASGTFYSLNKVTPPQAER